MTQIAGALLAMLLLLAGCASPGTIKPSTPDETQALWRQHRAKMSGISAWRLKGKIAIQTGTGTGTGPENGSATLVWAYRRDRQKIELYGPFGSGRVRITTQPGSGSGTETGGAVLKDTRGNTIEGANATEVLYRRLGWQVPFEQLQYWVRGIPNRGATGITLDHAGRLQTLRQGNWLVEYQDYAYYSDDANQLHLPRKLTITAAPGSMEIYARNGAYIGDQLSVTVILKRWRDIRFD